MSSAGARLAWLALLCLQILQVRPAVAQTTTPLSPRNANYTIDVTLDPRARSLTARERIVWRNITHTATGELQFHLYWNAWADTRSTWMRETLNRGDRRRRDFTHIEISALRLLGTPAVHQS